MHAHPSALYATHCRKKVMISLLLWCIKWRRKANQRQLNYESVKAFDLTHFDLMSCFIVGYEHNVS